MLISAGEEVRTGQAPRPCGAWEGLWNPSETSGSHGGLYVGERCDVGYTFKGRASRRLGKD